MRTAASAAAPREDDADGLSEPDEGVVDRVVFGEGEELAEARPEDGLREALANGPSLGGGAEEFVALFERLRAEGDVFN